MSTSDSQGHLGDPSLSVDGNRPSCTTRNDCCWSDCIDVRLLRREAATCFARVGISSRFVDTAVVRCLISVRSRTLVNPLGYCLAIGRRLQEESVFEANRRRSELEIRIRNTCPHGLTVEGCGECEKDREHALELFPSLRCYLPVALIPARSEES